MSPIHQSHTHPSPSHIRATRTPSPSHIKATLSPRPHASETRSPLLTHLNHMFPLPLTHQSHMIPSSSHIRAIGSPLPLTNHNIKWPSSAHYHSHTIIAFYLSTTVIKLRIITPLTVKNIWYWFYIFYNLFREFYFRDVEIFFLFCLLCMYKAVNIMFAYDVSIIMNCSIVCFLFYYCINFVQNAC